MLSRQFQRDLLTELAEIYPHKSNHKWRTEDDRAGVANVRYLIEHGLIEAHESKMMTGHIVIQSPRVTARGLDFLADDGGLHAILGVVTIRIDSSSIRELIESRLASEVQDETIRQNLIAALRKAPAETMSSAIQQLATAGLASTPALLPLLQKLLHL